MGIHMYVFFRYACMHSCLQIACMFACMYVCTRAGPGLSICVCMYTYLPTYIHRYARFLFQPTCVRPHTNMCLLRDTTYVEKKERFPHVEVRTYVLVCIRLPTQHIRVCLHFRVSVYIPCIRTCFHIHTCCLSYPYGWCPPRKKPHISFDMRARACA